jgi:hypothetical protein
LNCTPQRKLKRPRYSFVDEGDERCWDRSRDDPFAAAQDFPHGCGVSSKSACLAAFLIIENPNFPALVLARELVTLPIFKGAAMRRIAFLLIAVAALAIVVVSIIPASGQGNMTMAPGPGPAGKTPAGAVFVTQIPPGYRDWRLISVAHEEGTLHSFAAMLGNDTAIKAYRAGTLPYPDGTIIAALHYKHTPSAENDKVFGDAQSFVPGPPTNVQFMIKDSKKYAATGGWGFGSFGTDGKPGAETAMNTCFPCHAKASRDLVFTRYAPAPAQ